MKTSILIPIIFAASNCPAQTSLTAQDALALAAKNRPALKAAKLAIDQVTMASRALGALPPTTVGVGASTRSDVGATDQDLFLNQPLDVFGQRSANRRMGAAGVKLALAEYVATASNFQNDVLTAFSEAVAKKHHMEVAKELLKVAEGLLTATKRRFEEGKVAEIQVNRADIEFERAKQSAELRVAESSASLKRLAGLLGTDASEVTVASDAMIEPLSTTAVASRADLLILSAQVQIAEAGAGIAAVSTRPELSFQIVRSPWSDASGYFVGRAQMTWALTDHGKARNEMNAAKKRASATKKLLQDANFLANAEVAAAEVELKARQNRIKSYERILVSARELVAKSQRGFSEGFSNQIEVLEATRALREVEHELVEARQELSLAVIAQYKAVGFLAEVLK